MEFLYDVLYKFWGWFYGGTDFEATITPNLLNIVEFLAAVSVIAVVMRLIIIPLFGLLPWSKRQ